MGQNNEESKASQIVKGMFSLFYTHIDNVFYSLWCFRKPERYKLAICDGNELVKLPPKEI